MRVLIAFASVLFGGVLIGLPGGSALGALYGPVNPVAPAEGFLVAIEGGAYLGSNEIEGTVAIGGDLRIGSAFNVATNSADSYTVPVTAAPRCWSWVVKPISPAAPQAET